MLYDIDHKQLSIISHLKKCNLSDGNEKMSDFKWNGPQYSKKRHGILNSELTINTYKSDNCIKPLGKPKEIIINVLVSYFRFI